MDDMSQMSLLEHLTELRTRILRALGGLLACYAISLVFTNKLWNIVSAPAAAALMHLGVNPPKLAQITPMEGFTVIWVELPLLCAVFLASPWIAYQAWAFVSPGLYRHERRRIRPFFFVSGVLFLAGGLFGYFLAFRYGLEFLLGISVGNNIQPVVSVTEYFDLFVNVTVGAGLVFELPVVMFVLTMLGLLSPRWLFQQSRYAVIVIVTAAAVLTPSPDATNMMLLAGPMCALYFAGLLASYILVRRRERAHMPS